MDYVVNPHTGEREWLDPVTYTTQNSVIGFWKSGMPGITALPSTLRKTFANRTLRKSADANGGSALSSPLRSDRWGY